MGNRRKVGGRGEVERARTGIAIRVCVLPTQLPPPEFRQGCKVCLSASPSTLCLALCLGLTE